MIPTLSQIEAYTTDHLVDAADYWDRLADHWEDAHWQVRSQADSLDWRGVAGMPCGRAQHRITPLPATTPTNCAVPHASPVNRPASCSAYATGFSTRSRTLTTPVSPSGRTCRSPILEPSRTTAELAARQAQAQVFAADIRSRAGALIGTDNEVAGNLTGAAAGVGNAPLTEKPTYKPECNGTIQLAGFGAKQDPQLPPPPPAPQPDPPAIKLPPRTGPPPVAVITAEPPEVPPGPPTTITGTPLCPGDKILGIFWKYWPEEHWSVYQAWPRHPAWEPPPRGSWVAVR